MKVRCVADCFYDNREFRVDDMKYHGIYSIDLKPGEKIPPHLVQIDIPAVVPTLVKQVLKKGKVVEDGSF